MKRSRRVTSHSALVSQSSNASQLEPYLAGIFRDLARILVLNGFGYAGLNRIAKRAYFEAASQLDTETGSRTNKSRIAAATGLTRTEVSKLSRQDRRSGSLHPGIPVNRAQRVSAAWASLARYTDERGRPIELPVSGRSPSFSKLVKENSGDIPVKAMLSEMLRLKMVKILSGNYVRLLRLDAPMSRQTHTSLRALSPWVKFLSGTHAHQSSELNANSIQVTLRFESMPQLFAAVRDIQSRASAFVQTINELDGSLDSKARHQLDVTIALGTRVRQSSEKIVSDSATRYSESGNVR